MIPRRVKHAVLLAFFLHGILILTAQYRLSYDAYNHMFFADHYQKNGWSLWEPRWYTGFEVTSYPPLVHQLMGLLGHLIGVDAAFALLLWAVLTAYPLALYVFSRIFTGRVSASYAAIGAALLPSLYLSAYTFGQLPTLMGTLLALFGGAVLADFLSSGNKLTGALAISLFATVMAAHHAVLLFLPWMAGAIFLRIISQQRAKKLLLVFRFSTFVSLTVFAAFVVIWPFWDWGRQQVLQTPIDHLSRHNFLADPFALVLFFLPIYGLIIPFIPFALWLGLRRRFWGLGVAFLFLFLLGLGDTTLLPRLLFGEGWAWLTYDRFAFWASIILLPFSGALVVLLMRYKINQRKRIYFIGFLALTALIIGLIPSWLPTQPKPLDMQPIVDFLAQEDHAQFRYVTFGFGDQFAYLSRLTDATTIDGSYHTARTLPELRNSGIGQIDTTFWLPNGLSALDPILQKSGERGVRWGFVYLEFYIPVLERNGWVKRATLSNNVEVWENPSAILSPAVQTPPESPFTAFSWNTFPLLTLFITAALAIRRYWSSGSMKILSTAQAIATGLLPFGLTFWYYRKLFVVEQPRIYFTYSDALFFLSDGLALVIILTWLIGRRPVPVTDTALKEPLQLLKSLRSVDGWLFSLCLFASLSTLWSLEWRTSLYISLHLWLCLGLYFALRRTPLAWRWFALGCCAALVLQVASGVWQFVFQSTAVTNSLGLDWPGDLIPAMSGASVVQSADGTRWLRVYGTLPHPNLLGGFVLAMMVGPLTLFLLSSKPHFLPLPLFNAGLVLLALTFSRSAWLGLVVVGVVLLFHWKKLNYKSLILLGVTGLITVCLLFISLRPLLFTRLGAGQAETEQVSNYTRLWLVERTVELIRKHPLLGTGVGSYSLALSQHVAEFYEIEPVHNVLLLVVSELGIGGIVLLGGLAVVIAIDSLKAHHLAAVALSAVLIGLLVVSVFDHYLWTVAPGRTLLVTILGLWASQVKVDESDG